VTSAFKHLLFQSNFLLYVQWLAEMRYSTELAEYCHRLLRTMLKTAFTTWAVNISFQSAFKSGERSAFIQIYQP